VNILAVTTKSPFPLTEGRALRTYNLLREAAREHRITLCSYVQSREEQEGLGRLREFCSAVHEVPLYLNAPRLALAGDLVRDAVDPAPIHAIKYRRAAMHGLLEECVRTGDFDLAHLDMLHLGECLPAVASLPTVLVEHNVESRLLERRVDNESSPLQRAFLRRQARKLARYEREICESVDHVVAVSDDDRSQLLAMGVTRPVTVVPNAVDTEFFRPSAAEPPGDELVYVGSMAWFPNVDAVRFFCSAVLPRIGAAIPAVKLTVVGHLPSRGVVADLKRDPRVSFTGLVEDIRPIVGRAAAFVVPLRIGGGTRLKILDALAMGKALVTTPVGCEGLGLTDGAEALIAEEPASFADRVIALLRDRELARRLGAAGRRCVEARYRWDSIARLMSEVYARTAAGAERADASRLLG
jgi:polysaccharide biosynthesis protein PslH